ncbi:MAG: HIT family protein [Pseudomonadota bacterium]
MTATTGFSLDPRLESDTSPIASLALCELLLMEDARFPWLVLVPRRPGLADLIDLSAEGRPQATREIDAAARALKTATGCDKLNVAALGNMVRQLHIHVIARFESDAAWPGPVWGVGARTVYEASRRDTLVAAVKQALGAGPV